MNNNVFISCAVTGSGDTASKHPDLPKTPEQIAKSAIEAAKAGAAIAHIHVREEDGTPSRRLELYKEVVDRIRSSETDVILNLTTGMGGDLDIGQGKNPLEFGPMTDMANVMERIANACLLYTSPSPRDPTKSRMPSSAWRTVLFSYMNMSNCSSCLCCFYRGFSYLLRSFW